MSGNRVHMRRVLGFLRPYRRDFIIALLAMVIFGASDGVVPFMVKHVLDDVFAQQNKNLLIALPVILVIFAFIRGGADFGQQFLMSKIGLNIVRDIRNAFNRNLLIQSPDYFVSHSAGDLISRVTGDVLLMRTLLTDSVAAVLRDSIRVVALLVAAIYLDPTLALIAFVVFPIGIYPVYRFGRRMRRLSKRGQEAIGGLTGLLQQTLQGSRVVRTFGREDFEIERFNRENELLNETFIKSERVRALVGPVNEVLATVVIAAVIIYGGYTVIGGLRTQGDFIAFLISVFLLYDPFKKLSRVHSVIQQGMAGADRLFEVLDAVPSIQDPADPLPLGNAHTISFEGVTFRYGPDKEPALSNINITVHEGEQLAIVGFSGAGKSTLVDLIPRFIDVSEGRILVGGVDVRRVKLSELRSRIAIVGQHTFLFNDTIYNNIAYGHPNATREAVLLAAQQAYAMDFITSLPHGFDTVIGEGGFTLSGGERQRLAIARAILKDAPILILDEATASLDNRSELEVQRALDALKQNRTSIVIAHRLSSVRRADRIFVLTAGRIVEEGTFEELLTRDGEFAKLYALQFAQQESKDDVLVN